MPKNEVHSVALSLPRDAVRYALSAELAKAYPDLALVETDEKAFDIEEFAREGQCKIRVLDDGHPQVKRYWNGLAKRSGQHGENCFREVSWNGESVTVVSLSMRWQYCDEQRHYILASSKELAVQFLEAVCQFCGEVRGQVLVYEGGHWTKSRELYEAIEKTTYDEVVLANEMRETIRTDFERFFATRETYEHYKIPWKRGVLFLGPPGNGKTHMVKALANGLGVPCLYVRSFKAQYRTDHDTIHEVFEKARQTAPCLLVMEDLDSLVDAGNRSYFLNEMDGFAANTGIVTLASANYPERLDPAILDRPSRFDRKYHFSLPALAEREAYIRHWNESLGTEMRLDTAQVEQLAVATDEFSFAYLKELFLSGMMQWIHKESSVSMAETLLTLSGSLKEQMRTGQDAGGMADLPPAMGPNGADDEADGPPAVKARMNPWAA